MALFVALLLVSTPPKIAAEALRADADLLERAFTSLHPGLYRYNTKAQAVRLFQNLRGEFRQDRTLDEAFLALSRLMGKIRCGHTFLNPVNQSKAVAETLLSRDDRLPFYFRWLDGRMVVTRSFGAELSPGAEIVSIDGVPASKILATLVPYARADGANDAKRTALLEVQGFDRYETFDVFFPLLFPPKAGGFRLEVRPPGTSKTIRQTVAPTTYAARLAARSEEPDTDGDAPLWSLAKLDVETAILKMPTWVTYNSKWDWKTDLAKSFARLSSENVPNLVIDLRGNEGGTEVGSEIAAYLSRKDIRPRSYVRKTRYRRAPDDLHRHLDTWDRSFLDWGAGAQDPVDGFYRLTRYDDDAQGDLIRAKPQPYAGKTFVLIDSSNSSATFQFAELVKRNRLATLVGTPTGGSLRGINGGAFFFLRLPNSGLEIDLPLIGTFPETSLKDEGIRPDILVRTTREDIATGRDSAMKKVKELIGRG